MTGEQAGEGAVTAPPAPAHTMPVHTGWLYHHLLVRGDAAEVARFRAAAAGAGHIPWTHDLGGAAERWFELLAAPPEPQRDVVARVTRPGVVR